MPNSFKMVLVGRLDCATLSRMSFFLFASAATSVPDFAPFLDGLAISTTLTLWVHIINVDNPLPHELVSLVSTRTRKTD